MAKHTHQHGKPGKQMLKEALSLLANSKYRMTRPRERLLEMVLKQSKPFSVQTLEKLLKNKDGCDQVTIYRTLPVFVELGIIERCDFSSETANYEVSLGASGHHHHHVVCTSCQKVEHLDVCIVDDQTRVLEKLGYRSLKHRLEFSGLCPKCSA